jgi:hypothetical protein
LVTNIATPALALDVVISGNGSDSNSEVKVENERETYLEQTNNTQIKNKVNLQTNTGGNGAEDNTNGDIVIKTGDSESAVSIVNNAGMNAAELELCDCDLNAMLKIEGNGSDSKNEVEVNSKTKNEAFQDNNVDVNNDVKAESNTGDNNADDNTGGEVSIDTGDVSTLILTKTSVGLNALRMKAGNGNGGMLSAWISGNGSDSENEIELDHETETYVEQTNEVDVDNDIDGEVNSGDNSADDNTGGLVEIETGDVELGIGVETNSSFNFADVEGCGCLLDGLVKIMGNGTDSDNEVEVEVEDQLEVFQDNDDDIETDIDGELETGDNSAEDNTGGVDGDDPSIETGDAEGVVSVENNSGFNSLGGAEFEFSFDWAELLAAFGL